MASGSFTGTTSNSYITPKIEWSSAPDTETNTSVVTASLLLYKDCTYANRTYGTGAWEIVIDGAASAVNHGGTPVTLYSGAGWVNVGTASKTVSHLADGSKTIGVWATGGISGTSYTSTNCSSTITLDTIPRASSVSAAAANFGGASNITIQRASSSFTHTLTYSFGLTSGTIADKTGSTSVSWCPPVSLTEQIPNDTSGTCTITCETFSGTTSLGAKTCAVTLSVPPGAVPTMAEGAAIASPYSTNSVVSGWGIFVQSYSAAEVTFDSGKIAGVYGSTISSYSLTYEGVTVSSPPYRTDTIASYGTKQLVATVTDSRGRTASQSLVVYVYPYSAPGFSSASCFRSVSDGTAAEDGTYIHIEAVPVISSCGENNQQALQYRYKSSSGSFGDWTSFSGTSVTLGGGGILTTSSYIVEARVTDSLSNLSLRTFTVPTDSVSFNIKDGGAGAAFFKYAETDGALEVDGNVSITGSITLGQTGLTESQLISLLALL